MSIKSPKRIDNIDEFAGKATPKSIEKATPAVVKPKTFEQQVEDEINKQVKKEKLK